MAEAARRPNSWVIDFYDQDGLRRWKTMPEGSTKDVANEELAKILKKLRNDTLKLSWEMPKSNS